MKWLLIPLCLLVSTAWADPGLRIVSSCIVESATSSGPTWTQLPVDPAAQVQIENLTGTTIEVQYFGKGKTWPMVANSFKTFRGITDASQLYFRRVDQATTPVTINILIER